MESIGHITLRDRRFDVSAAEMTYDPDDGTWRLEIHTQKQVIDGQEWSPYLYHQALRLAVATPQALVGLSTSWDSVDDDHYPHPEPGVLSVFRHEDVYACTLTFAASPEGGVWLTWTGIGDVHWDEPFRRGVPFRCECRLS